MLVRLDSPESYNTFKDWLTSNPQANVSVRREADYYVAQSTTLTQADPHGRRSRIAVLMGIGAVFGAMLTMYTAVATRSREIATLRALGFNTLSVLRLGARRVAGPRRDRRRDRRAAAYLAFNGYQTSTINFQTFSQVAFAFAVTPALLAQGLGYALVDGTRRRPAAGAAGCAAADPLGAPGAIAVRQKSL